MSNKNVSWICVNKEFHKKLKQEAAEDGKTIIDYTEELTRKIKKEKGKKINDFWRMI